MRRNLRFAALSFVTVALAFPVCAQQGFAVVDVDRLFMDSDRGKEIKITLQKEFAAQLDDMRNKEAALTALRSRIASQSTTLSEEALGKLRREFEDSQLELKRLTEDVESEVKKRQTELFNVLEKDVLDLIEEIRKEKGLAAVFSKQAMGLLAAEPSIDITNEVMQRLNTKP
jgi:outer membrane protein